MELLKTLDDLKPAPYNPRKINKKAAETLKKSLSDFGDLSGIVWNKKTGNLVCGHQRVEQLKKLGAQINCDTIIAAGEKFQIRIVDWNEKKEKLANIIANNTEIAGEFTDDLKPLLCDIKADIGDTEFNDLMLDYFEDEIKKSDEWRNAGMEEFVSEKIGARSIIVHFMDLKDVKTFADLVEQKITEKTKYIWFPCKQE